MDGERTPVPRDEARQLLLYAVAFVRPLDERSGDRQNDHDHDRDLGEQQQRADDAFQNPQSNDQRDYRTDDRGDGGPFVVETFEFHVSDRRTSAGAVGDGDPGDAVVVVGDGLGVMVRVGRAVGG